MMRLHKGEGMFPGGARARFFSVEGVLWVLLSGLWWYSEKGHCNCSSWVTRWLMESAASHRQPRYTIASPGTVRDIQEMQRRCHTASHARLLVSNLVHNMHRDATGVTTWTSVPFTMSPPNATLRMGW
ncbi:hypothetical protein OE88DRAFT_1129823 [Heliocybe sulcata]|uniref:Uncharacterized protein n=1 Tax=Heliocybe sulcata TaxID=5364 RepID=A0A5C3N983_9AGAM|nr:hypothetical protein OE88DRAFT_1129823 [Heliocybe sulcata]